MEDQLIIYPNFAQRISSWDINHSCGKYDLPLIRTADNNSVVLYIVDQGDQPNNNNDHIDQNFIKPANYHYIESKPLFSIGSRVAVSNEVSTHGKYVVGTISKIGSDHIEVVAMVNDKVRTYRITQYKQISTMGEASNNDYLEVNIGKDDRGTLKLSYLFGEIGWKTHYTMILDGDRINQFKLSATITNGTGTTLNGKISLVAGSVRRPVTQSHQPRAMLMASPQSEAIPPSSSHSEFDEHYKYELEEPQCIDHKKRLDLVTCSDAESQKYYSHDVNSGNWVEYGYKFKSPAFLPTGEVYIYSQENRNILYTGTSSIKEYREGDEVDLVVGKTTQVQINSNVIVNSKEIEDNNITIHERDVTIQSEVDNTSDEPVLVILKYRVGNSSVGEVSLEPSRRKDGYLEWDMMANPSKGALKIDLVLSN